MERSLSMELVRVTEAAALAAARWMGRGKKAEADEAATQSEEELARCKKMGIEDVNQVLRMEDLVKGDDAIFAATGVTDGELLKGVQYNGNVGTTQSVVMRAKSGTVRFIDGKHSLKKKPDLVIKS